MLVHAEKMTTHSIGKMDLCQNLEGMQLSLAKNSHINTKKTSNPNLGVQFTSLHCMSLDGQLAFTSTEET